MPLHVMAKAAPFLILEIFEKGLKTPLWTSVWQLLFTGDYFFYVDSHDCTKNFFGTSTNSATQGGGGHPIPASFRRGGILFYRDGGGMGWECVGVGC